MAEIIDDITHLTQEIGPHPSGTEEEQQAALYLAEKIQNEAGFSTIIEDFQCVTNDQVPRFAFFGAALVSVLLALFLPVALLPCFILSLAAAVLFVLEATGRPVLTRFLRTGASQNVVAKYQPPQPGGAKRQRKIILVANYDSGKALQEEKPPIAGFLGYIQKASAIALLALPVLLLLRMTLFAGESNPVGAVINFLLVICLILFVLPLVRSGLHVVAPYNQSANNNAAGVAVLAQVARRVGHGLVSSEELEQRGSAEGSVVHGEEAARAAGVVPSGASLEYEAQMSPQESLAAAKAAIAALTGKPVADKVPVTDISSRLVKGGGLDVADDPAASEVHFEVGEAHEATESQKAASRLRRSMSSIEASEPTTTSQAGDQVDSAEPADSAEQAEGAESASKQEPSASEVTPAAEAESFKREAPAALQPHATDAAAGGVSAGQDRTPAWARAAQAKARANKPEASQPRTVARSRYADTPAAMMSVSASPNTMPSFADAGYGVSAPDVEAGEASDLGRRLSALRAEIESAEAPQAHTGAQVEAPIEAPTETPTESVAPASAAEEAKPTGEPVVSSSAAFATAEPKAAEPTAVKPEVPTSKVLEEEPAGDAEAKGATSKPAQQEEDISRTAVMPVASSDAEFEEESSFEEPTDSLEASRTATVRPAARRAPHSRTGSSQVASLVQRAEGLKSKVSSMAQSALSSVRHERSDAQMLDQEEPASEPIEDDVDGLEALDDPDSASSAESLDEVGAQVDEESTSTEGKPTRGVSLYTSKQTAKREEAPAASADQAGAPAAAKTPSRTPASPSSTTAMAPIDVSAFLDKEEIEEPVEPERVQISQEETQKVSSEQIQDAIHEASARVSQVELREPENVPDVVSPIMGMESMIPQVPLAEPEPAGRAGEAAKQVIVLPDVVSARTSETNKQRAPMAEASEDTQAGTKSLLSNMLPSIGDSAPLPVMEDEPSKPASLDLPTFGTTEPNQAVSATGSFSTVGGTGSFAPVGDELVADIAPEERYVDDADDSAYDEDYTQTGAFAGQGYVDMPKSRVGRLFGRFRRKKKEQEVPVSAWVDVDDGYSAQSAGQARGSCSSFNNEGDSVKQDNTASKQSGFVDVDYHENEYDQRGWNGGAFSLNRLRKGQQATQPEEDGAALEEVAEPATEGQYVAESPAVRIDGDINTAEEINRELRKLQDFRHPDINTEVWFVALGSELYSHSGIQAFLDEHADEMKGAIIVNLEALGAGALTLLEAEGVYKQYKPSSRIKRIVRQACDRCGVPFRTATMAARETPASIAMARGVQAFTICGMGDSNTALYAADNDVMENIDEEQLEEAADFVMAILKSV